MTNVVVIAPHPDDETLGCGGTLLKHIARGDRVSWVIMTQAHSGIGYNETQIDDREVMIDNVASAYGFSSTHRLNFPSTTLDHISLGDIIGKLNAVFQQEKPEIVYMPFVNDIHSDHYYTVQAVHACSKSFRHPEIKKVISYETPSETDFALPPSSCFQPNLFIDISEHYERKIEILSLYEKELGQHPFPRSYTGIDALAVVRGAAAGAEKAESFMLLKEIW